MNAESELRGRVAELAKDALLSLMADISEDHYCASWLTDLEYDLYEMVRGGSRNYGMGEVETDSVATLRRLADEAGGWWTYEAFVPLPEWRDRFAKWYHEKRLPGMRATVKWMRETVGEKDFFGRARTEADVAAAEAALRRAEANVPPLPEVKP